MPPDNPPDSPDPMHDTNGRVPERLARDLARLHAPANPEDLRIPAEVDDHVRLMARHQLTQAGSARTFGAARHDVEQTRRRRLASIRLITVSAVAAVLTLTGLVLPRLGFFTPPAPSLPSGATAGRADSLSTIPSAPDALDVNNDGVVDILDAQRLAYLLRTDGPRVGNGGESGKWDFNHDGTLDDADARAIAQHVVALKKNGGAG